MFYFPFLENETVEPRPAFLTNVVSLEKAGRILVDPHLIEKTNLVVGFFNKTARRFEKVSQIV
jgi:hypothetical protein